MLKKDFRAGLLLYALLHDDVDGYRCADEWRYGVEWYDALRARQHADDVAQQCYGCSREYGCRHEVLVVVGAEQHACYVRHSQVSTPVTKSR